MRKKLEYVNSLYEWIVGAVRFSSEKIMEFINKNNEEKIFPLPEFANPHTLGETLFPVMYDIWKHTLNNYHAIHLRLQEFQTQNTSFSHSDPTFVVLDILRYSLACFISKFYVELHRFDNKVPSAQSLLLRTINEYFLVLESEIGKTQLGSLSFERLPYEHIDCLNHTQLTDAVDVISSNLNKLDQFLSLLLTNDHEPKLKSQRLMHYTFGSIGISVLSMWFLRDSRLSGIINNWVLETKDSTVRFLRDNVEQPLTYIRDGLVEAYRDSNSSKGVIESKRLQATSDLIHSMLLDFGERRGLKFPPNASDQEMYNIVENSFGEQRSLFGGVSAHSMLIQLLKLNLEVGKTIPKLEYLLLFARQSKFVILAFIPTIFLSLGVGILSYALDKLGTKITKYKERIGQAQRTRLLLEVEKYVEMQKIRLSSQFPEDLEDPDYVNGLLLYYMDQLYRAVKKQSKALGDWRADWVRWSRYIEFLGNPDGETSHKLELIYHFQTDVPYLFSLESLKA